MRTLLQLAVQSEHIIIYRDLIAGLHLQIVGQPFGDDHVVAGGRDASEEIGADPGDHRVRRGIGAVMKIIGNVG